MKTITLIVAFVLLAGCAGMTEHQKRTGAIVGAILGASLIIGAAQDGDDDEDTPHSCAIISGAGGSRQFCQ